MEDPKKPTIIMKREDFLKTRNYHSLPNLISLFRLLSVIPLFALAFLRLRTEFTVLYILAAASDWIDGFVAKKLKKQTEFGSKLDSLADEFFYDSTLIWLFIFFPQIFFENAIIWIPLIGISLFLLLITLRDIGAHTRINKLAAFCFMIFTFYTLIFGYNNILFYITISIVAFAKIDNLILVLKKNRFARKRKFDSQTTNNRTHRI